MLECARDGDDEAFSILLARHSRSAWVIARGVLGDPHLAEDVCQDAVFKAWQRLEDCREPERFGAWLGQIVRRHALNALRQRRETEPLAGEPIIDPSVSPARAAERADLRARLSAALAQLAPEQREVVLLFDLEGWSHAEIAGLLETSEAMSRQHLLHARRRLRTLLGTMEER